MHKQLLYATSPFLLSRRLDIYILPGFIHQDNLAHESPHCLYSHDKPWGALMRKQVQTILWLWGWTLLLLLSLCQAHPPLPSFNTSSTTRKTKQQKNLITGNTMRPFAGSSLSTGTYDHHHYEQRLMAAVLDCLFTQTSCSPRGSHLLLGSLSSHFTWLHISIADQSQFKTLFRSTYSLLLTHCNFQYSQSHTSIQAHCATLTAGQLGKQGN